VQRHKRLACADRHLHGELRLGVGLVQLLDRLQDAQARPYRPLRVVLAGERSSEHGDHGVADELLDGAAETLEFRAEARVVGGE
jgi:hypothetical protein